MSTSLSIFKKGKKRERKKEREKGRKIKVRPQRIHTIWLHLYEVQIGKTKVRIEVKIVVLFGGLSGIEQDRGFGEAGGFLILVCRCRLVYKFIELST